MDEAVFESKLNELVKEMSTTPGPEPSEAAAFGPADEQLP